MSFDKLHALIKKTDKLLNDRHEGLYTWNCFLCDNLIELDRVIEDLGVDVERKKREEATTR